MIFRVEGKLFTKGGGGKEKEKVGYRSDVNLLDLDRGSLGPSTVTLIAFV